MAVTIQPAKPDSIDYQVYFKRANGKLGQASVPIVIGTDDPHAEAILQVKEHLVGTGEGYSGAVLTVIPGAKVDQPLVA